MTGLSFPVAANTTYRFRALIVFNSISSADGCNFAINGPASPTLLAIQGTSGKSTTDYFRWSATAYDVGGGANSSNLGNNIATLEGVITTGATSGTIIIRASGSVANKMTVNSAVSTIEYW